MSTIYKCTKKVKFVAPDNPNATWEMAPGYIGEVPSWVEKDWYFKALCDDGSVTAIKSSSDRDIQAATDNKSEETPPTGETPPSTDETPPPANGDKGEGSTDGIENKSDTKRGKGSK